MISQAELDRFFERLVTTAPTQGGVCAITSPMACVPYGVASATKDCDLLCLGDSAGQRFLPLRLDDSDAHKSTNRNAPGA